MVLRAAGVSNNISSGRIPRSSICTMPIPKCGAQRRSVGEPGLKVADTIDFFDHGNVTVPVDGEIDWNGKRGQHRFARGRSAVPMHDSDASSGRRSG